ncbi:molybdenum ABC transporter ATP-binding protein [Allochromatium vinosum]|uniref:Molybdate ABC transporter, ATPase subunit n=1 Tax=Allochromatium vinosum (strain ATCC 17899 / DSM 180 / NBRC 103801 / NCIMB 10441 / D) TaxID=572477 RepID=D3RR03_ALLVD|nr:molybdenum ABC transporter ATP-binding protein [Allochromatium vinosum]ADC61831.1 molybdate ABC transporter, ATPase subunit [Allochromatium vinosum DSM 180]MBK1653950.1 molybdenum ABC transporter ATP-binding protein [Allochromatium vinosum]
MKTDHIQARFQLDYPEFTLNVDLELPGRGVTALFGHSGSGKTTLLRLIAGLIRIQDGRLSVNGEVWQDDRIFLPTHKRPLGYVFQEASLFPHLTARGNLEYGMKRVGNAMDGAALEQAVALLGIGHLLDRRPHQLSGGERQRVAIARALAVQPRLLLMDEPLAALDLKRKQEILPYLERLHDALEIPVLYVSHSPDEVARLADTVVLMEQGRVRAQGAVNELFSRLDLAFAQDQEASAIIEGVVLSHDDDYALTRLEIQGGHLSVARLNRDIHELVRVRIHARDVSLALDEPGASSILNILPARILEMREIEQAQVLVKLCTGAGEKTPLLARITRHSRDRLRLHEGQSVFAQVKAVALMD